MKMLKTIIVLLILMGSKTIAQVHYIDPKLDAMMPDIVSKIAASLPQRTDGMLVLGSVAYANGTLIWRGIIDPVDKYASIVKEMRDNHTEEVLNARLKQADINKLCSHKYFRPLMQLGLVFRYSYKYIDFIYAMDHSVAITDCQ